MLHQQLAFLRQGLLCKMVTLRRYDQLKAKLRA